MGQADDLRSVDADDPPGRMPEASDQPRYVDHTPRAYRDVPGSRDRRWASVEELRVWALDRCREHGLDIRDIRELDLRWNQYKK